MGPCNNIRFQCNPKQVIYTISKVLDMSPSGNFDIIGQCVGWKNLERFTVANKVGVSCSGRNTRRY